MTLRSSRTREPSELSFVSCYVWFSLFHEKYIFFMYLIFMKRNYREEAKQQHREKQKKVLRESREITYKLLKRSTSVGCSLERSPSSIKLINLFMIIIMLCCAGRLQDLSSVLNYYRRYMWSERDNTVKNNWTIINEERVDSLDKRLTRAYNEASLKIN